MAQKIGRNKKCPCGSNKKYKHCCLNKNNKSREDILMNTNNSHINLRKYFAAFHNIDLVLTLAALSIHPSNHGKNLRLEYLTIEALSTKSYSQKLVQIDDLKDYLDKNFAHLHLEDPPSNLFTENVIYPLGNSVVYGGNFAQGAFILNTIITTIQFNSDLFPKQFVKVVNDGFKLLLFMSDMIAKQIGHRRNMLGDYENSKSEIEFPPNIDEYKKALFFSNEWLDRICQEFRINKSIISHFILKESDRSKLINEIGDPCNPLLSKPLAKLTNGILVAFPSSILSSLTHFVWTQAMKFNCKEELIKEFHTTVWDELSFMFGKLHFESEEFSFKKNDNLPIKNALYRIDTDKLVFVTIVYDLGEKYDLSTPFHEHYINENKAFEEFHQANWELLEKKYKGSRFIELTLYSSIGREYIVLLPQNQNTYSLVTSTYKFLCLIKAESHENMSLWYFLEALHYFESSFELTMPTCILEYFAFYRKNKSFYISDGKKPSCFVIMGIGLHVIKDAIRGEDKIVAFHKINNMPHSILLPVIKVDKYIPRYLNIGSIGHQLEYYIPGYDSDIWLRAKDKASEIGKNEFHIYWEFSEAICYWFWQIKDMLKTHLSLLEKRTFLITFELINIELFGREETFGLQDDSIFNKFDCTIAADNIKIQIPAEIEGHINSMDNKGERIIITKLLEYIGKYLEFNNKKNTLTSKVIKEIIDEKIPLGLKKMLLSIHTRNSISLNPINVEKPRLLQESRKQLFMERIISMLGENCPPEGEIIEKTEKEKLTRNLVSVLLNELKKILKEFNSTELLVEAMTRYEAIVHENAMSKIRTPSRLHCFSEKEDIVTEIQKKTKLIDESSIVLRCLIEHLAAEPTNGNTPINQEIIDDAMALMSLILWWGSVGDKVKYDLFDIQLAILPSQRVGTNSREISEQFFDKFSKTRTEAYIQNTVDTFQSYFIEEKKDALPVPTGFDKAFTNEFGISFGKLGGIVDLLIQISFEHKDFVSRISVADLVKEIKKSFEVEFTDREIHSALDVLKLWDRGEVRKAPKGFKSIDISPWRYNRKLSYLQRPLIFVDYGEHKDRPFIYWTPRHLDRAWTFLNNLFMSGRYRANEKSDLEKQMSSIAKSRGAIVQKEVKRWLANNDGLFIDEEVKISSKGKLKNSKDLGDSDIFCIDHTKKIIFSIECKRTAPAKNSKEMVEQVNQYFGSGSKEGYFTKHLKRHSWLSSNLPQVGEVYGLELSDYHVVSTFVTYEIMAIQFMENRLLPLPLLSLHDLKQMSYDEFCERMLKPIVE